MEEDKSFRFDKYRLCCKKIMMEAANIKLFGDLTQIEIEGNFYDLHNTYNCEALLFKENGLLLKLRGINDAESLQIKFADVSIAYIDFNFGDFTGNLTIDQLYRGRFERDREVYELADKRCFFYLSFVEGAEVHFFSDGLSLSNS